VLQHRVLRRRRTSRCRKYITPLNLVSKRRGADDARRVEVHRDDQVDTDSRVLLEKVGQEVEERVLTQALPWAILPKMEDRFQILPSNQLRRHAPVSPSRKGT
jgi:hypothetical protein